MTYDATSSEADVQQTGIKAPARDRLHWLGFGIILVQFTELDGAIAVMSGITTQVMATAILTALSLVYLTANYSTAYWLLRSRHVIKWLAALLLFPMFIMLLQTIGDQSTTSDFVYWSQFYLSIAVLFVNVMVFAARSGTKALLQLTIGAILVTFGEFYVQQSAYGFLREVLTFMGSSFSKSRQSQRYMGFYGHPNMAAVALAVSAAIATVMLLNAQRRLMALAVLISAFAGILLAGSRTSLILLSVATILIFWRYIGGARTVQSFTTRMGVPVIFFGSVIVATLLLSGTEDASVGLALDRVTQLLDSPTSDQSANIRGQVIWDYIEYSWGQPLLGYGPQATANLVDSRYGFIAVSQNEWIQWAIELGWPYTIYVGGLLIGTTTSLWRLRRLGDPEAALVSRMGALFMLLFFIGTFSYVQMFFMKSLLVLIGYFVGLMMRERYLASLRSESTS